MKQKTEKDKIQSQLQSNELLINDDEDKFMKKLEGVGDGEKMFEMDREQEKQRKREAKKDLKFYAQQEVGDIENIKKCFYIESAEISKMSEKEVQEFRKVNGDIKVRGVNCLKPIKNWYQCGLPNPIIDLIEKKKFLAPFPI